ncbi:hypothetical protein CBM2609_A70013 [Cupriavidus taiwanensis]|nr:hypothetical protein CBM2604_A60013 [Cupriavidus taiwanensis]SOZ28720.1 hypothetical protein CBM2609_A70013 [Cupriavidus taiwanensis]SOZ46181.1 hypothetical protein CBM2610_A70449 [Cupriavidus taiwanensis]
MARLAGFEPTTPWFVAKYSIQLSYSRTREKDYNPVFVFVKPPSNFFVIFIRAGSMQARRGAACQRAFPIMAD